MTATEPAGNIGRDSAPAWAAAGPALIAGFAMFGLAGAEQSAEAAAEGRYLALTATAVLLAAAGVARRPFSAPTLALPVIVVLAFVALPPGAPERGAAVGALLCLGPSALLLDSLLARRQHIFLPAGSLDPPSLHRLGRLLAAAYMGANLLMRQAELLDGSTLRLLTVLVVLPVIAAAVVVVLFARFGAPALAGAAALILLAGGLRSNVVLVLAAAAAADAAARAIRRRWARPGALAGFLLVVVVVPLLLRTPAFGTLVAAMAAALVWRRLAFAIVLVAGGALTMWLPPADGAPWSAVLAALPLALIGAPHLIGRGGLRAVAASVLLCLAGLRFLPPEQALLAGVALWTVLASRQADRETDDDPPPTGPWRVLALSGDAAVFGYCLQGGLIVFAMLSASYPWLQPAHLEDRLRAFGLGVSVEQWLALGGILVLAHGSSALVRRTPAPRVVVLALAAVLLTTAALGAWDAFRPRRDLLVGPRVELTVDNPSWSVGSGGCGRLVMDASVANSAGVAPGQPVLLAGVAGDAAPEPLILRHGEDTGEWSARSGGGIGGEKPWLHWVAVGADGPFFGARYRTERHLTSLCGRGDLIVSRAPGLPAATTVTLFSVLETGDRDP